MVDKETVDTGRHASYGVEALIERLREEGVERGTKEAERIVAEAKQKAVSIVSRANSEADEIVSAARSEAESLKAAGRDALELAARDAHLKLRETVTRRFGDEVRRLVGTIMKPEPFMEQLILQVAGRAREQAGLDREPSMTIALPESVIDIDDLRKNPESLEEGTLAHFVVSVMASLLREGITYRPAGEIGAGLKIYLKDGDVEVDLTDEAIAAVLLEHLQPRFRALLEGIVK